MTDAKNPEVEQLLDLLDLQSVGEGLFSGPPAPSMDGVSRVFGGQVLAQALAAACRTVNPESVCHSLHAYFVRPGKPGRPIEYEVSAMRDGQSFALRKVVGVQRDEVTCELITSFEHAPNVNAPPQSEFQTVMPDTPAPATFPGEEERTAWLIEQTSSPEHRARLERKSAIEIIHVDARPSNDGGLAPAAVRRWMRVRAPLVADPNLHRCLLAFASDMGALEPSMRAIGARFGDPDLQVASLDHAVWFHRPFRFDEWLLFVFESASVGAGRGLSRGSVFARSGELVASIAQEGLMRPTADPGA
jgi:acyl-CoA thioesterase-2